MRSGATGLLDLLIGAECLDPLQLVRGGARQFPQKPIESEAADALGRLRHGHAEGAKDYRHGNRPRTVIGLFGRVSLST